MGATRDDLSTEDAVHPDRGGVVRMVSELSGDVVTIVDANGRITQGAEEFEAAFPAWVDGDGANLLSFVHPADVTTAEQFLQQARERAGEVVTETFRLRGVEDKVRYVDARALERVTKTSRCTVLALRDVTHRVHMENALRTLRAGNQVLLQSLDEMDLVQRMCATMVNSGHYRLAWVGYAQDDSERRVLPVAASGDTDYIEGIRISWADNEFGHGPTGIAIRTNTIQVVEDVRTDAAYAPWRERALAHAIVTSCVLPLSQNGRVIGAVSIYSSEIGAFNAGAVNLLQELAEEITYGIARIRDAARLTDAFESMVAALTAVSELRDPYTAGHQKRVGMLAAAIARKMGLPLDSIQWIRIAGELHDLGKIMIPAEILAKPGRLNDPEMALMRGHPQAAFDIVKGIHFPGRVAEMVLQHHERLDGSGYPHGLRGDDILLGSRILAVADTVEAMANHRPYRPAVGLDAALDVLRASAGTTLDPLVVAACTELFEVDRFGFDHGNAQLPPSVWVQPLTREIPPTVH